MRMSIRQKTWQALRLRPDFNMQMRRLAVKGSGAFLFFARRQRWREAYPTDTQLIIHLAINITRRWLLFRGCGVASALQRRKNKPKNPMICMRPDTGGGGFAGAARIFSPASGGSRFSG